MAPGTCCGTHGLLEAGLAKEIIFSSGPGERALASDVRPAQLRLLTSGKL